MTLPAYKTKLETLVPGAHPLEAVALDGLRAEAVRSAVSDYSKNRPRLAVADIAGDGGRDYPLETLTGWTSGFSAVRSVEYPVDETADYEIALLPAGCTLRLVDPDEAEIGGPIRVWYTIPHVVDDTTCTVSAGDESAVQLLAAAYYCEFLAAAYATHSNPVIRADSAGSGKSDKSAAFLKLAKTHRAKYETHMGIQNGRVKAASASRSVRKREGIFN